MANDATNEVVWSSGFQRDGGGAAAVRSEGIAHSATAVVTSTHFIHGVPTWIFERYIYQEKGKICKLLINITVKFWKPIFVH